MNIRLEINEALNKMETLRTIHAEIDTLSEYGIEKWNRDATVTHNRIRGLEFKLFKQANPRLPDAIAWDEYKKVKGVCA